MITKDDMMEPMLEACPSFRPQWEAFLAEWSTDDDKPLFLALSDLARHLIEKLVTQDATSLLRAFAVIERWHIEGDAYVQEAATVGLLEDLQNGHLHGSTTPKAFEPFLLPESLRRWHDLYRFWNRGETTSDD